MKKTILALAMIGFSCISCSKQEGMTEQAAQQHTLTAKLVGGTEGETMAGSILVRLDAQSAGLVKGGSFGEISSKIFGEVEVTSFRSALPVQPKNTEVAKKYGLDQWFIAEFDQQTPVTVVAEKVAQSPRVRSLQYNKFVEPIVSDKVFEADEFIATKAVDVVAEGFNDPLATTTLGSPPVSLHASRTPTSAPATAFWLMLPSL